jgi:nitrate reductase alpha subunit
MVIIGAAMNHWYHMDMNYRGVINLLAMCGCIGQSGGGWSHYVGQEKLRPQTGWAPLAFALDWIRPPRQQNSTSFFYAHTDQWRYETLDVKEILSPTAPEGDWGQTFIDYNAKAERMGWLPSAPALKSNSLDVAKAAEKSGGDAREYVARELASKRLEMSCMDPDHPDNWPRNMFVWRSNLLGSSGKACSARILATPGAVSRLMSPGATRRRKESSISSSPSISACPRRPFTVTSCCRRRRGTKRTISTRRTCTPSSTR